MNIMWIVIETSRQWWSVENLAHKRFHFDQILCFNSQCIKKHNERVNVHTMWQNLTETNQNERIPSFRFFVRFWHLIHFLCIYSFALICSQKKCYYWVDGLVKTGGKRWEQLNEQANGKKIIYIIHSYTHNKVVSRFVKWAENLKSFCSPKCFLKLDKHTQDLACIKIEASSHFLPLSSYYSILPINHTLLNLARRGPTKGKYCVQNYFIPLSEHFQSKNKHEILFFAAHTEITLNRS